MTVRLNKLNKLIEAMGHASRTLNECDMPLKASEMRDMAAQVVVVRDAEQDRLEDAAIEHMIELNENDLETANPNEY